MCVIELHPAAVTGGEETDEEKVKEFLPCFLL